MIRTIFPILIVTVQLCAATLLIGEGQTWPYAEQNALDEIQVTLQREKPQIEKRLKESSDEAKKRLESYVAPNVHPLPRAQEDKVFLVDMRYTLDRDITNQDGSVIFKKGYTFNPLDSMSFLQKIVVFDPTDKAQKDWFLSTPYKDDFSAMILITAGAALQVTKELQRPVMYLTHPIAQRFHLQSSPCVIVQQGRSMAVYEFTPRMKRQKR